MATEQYSIGYEEGFQNGWNAAVDSLPAQRKPLTDEEIENVWANCSVDWDDTINVLTLARAIEAAHGIGEKK